MTQIIDEAALRELRTIMGGDFQLLIDTFVADSDLRVAALENAIATGDAEALRTSAHSFKGSSLNISAIGLTELCRDLEDRGKESRLDGADQVLADVKIAYSAVKEYFGCTV